MEKSFLQNPSSHSLDELDQFQINTEKKLKQIKIESFQKFTEAKN